MQSLSQKCTWVLGNGAYFNSSGRSISLLERILCGLVFDAPGIALASKQCIIRAPLSTSPLVNLMQLLECLMEHNFYPTLMTAGAQILVLHYNELLERLKFCPNSLLYSLTSGTGKS